MQNLILIGFMGAGKSSVGKLLARERGMRFIDTDEEIEKAQGMRISDIFKEYGEERFRDMETELLKQMNEDRKEAVISAGGGMPVREENRVLLRSLGRVIYLTAEKETILKRVHADGQRPLLSGENLEQKVERLMREREQLYHQAAHLEIRTDGRGIREISQLIQKEIFNI